MSEFFHRIILISVLTGVQTVSAQSGVSELYDIVNQFEQDERALIRKYTLRYSDEYYSRFKTFYKSASDRLESIDYPSLELQGKADYLLLRNLIEKRIYFVNEEYDRYKSVEHFVTPVLPLFGFIRDRRSGTQPDGQSVSRQFEKISNALSAQQLVLRDKPFKNQLEADLAVQVLKSWQANLEEAIGFYRGYDPEFTWWLEMPYEKFQERLKEYIVFLGNNVVNNSASGAKPEIPGRPIGRDAVIRSLQLSYIPYSPEELIKAAESQFKYCREELLGATAALGLGNDWKAALEFVKDTYVRPGHQPALIDSLAREAVTFLEDRDLITVPDLSKETWQMIMMTPERQLVNPFFTGGEVISISYPTNTMEDAQKMMSMRGNNPHFSQATVHHELIPGHHLQEFMINRYKPYRQAFMTPFWIEGWALYWEINLWNKDFADTPEEKIGMLFWRMHRCARIVFSLNYHLGKMSANECVDYLVNEVGHEYANAEAEVRRSFAGGYEPLYQVAYMVGGLQFYALRNEMLSIGWTEKQYHDAVLKEGPIPVEILRLILMNSEVSREYTTGWKFSTDFK